MPTEIEQLLARIHSAQTADHTLLVAIDGFGGAGRERRWRGCIRQSACPLPQPASAADHVFTPAMASANCLPSDAVALA